METNRNSTLEITIETNLDEVQEKLNVIEEQLDRIGEKMDKVCDHQVLGRAGQISTESAP
ncbi:hypothetical protein [Alteribacillus sp. YIM 98480]|uniref:hypothetical protein n=1 Tax=Alteribacillus sp. YIM 98480 TaxID=2606599 RepID=UPI00131CACF5|nr:hypothetical protein [Alteribacillus sp. YIM 98480]